MKKRFYTMLVAIFKIQFSEPFARKVLAVFHTTAYVAIFILGPGKFSLDHLLFGKK